MPIVKIYNTGEELYVAEDVYGLNRAIATAACAVPVFGFSEKDFSFFQIESTGSEEGEVLIEILAVYPKPERTREHLYSLAESVGSAAREFFRQKHRLYPVTCIVDLLPVTSTVWESEDSLVEN